MQLLALRLVVEEAEVMLFLQLEMEKSVFLAVFHALVLFLLPTHMQRVELAEGQGQQAQPRRPPPAAMDFFLEVLEGLAEELAAL